MSWEDDLYSMEKKIRQLSINSSSSSLDSVFSGGYTLVPTIQVTTSGTVSAGAVAIAFHLSNDFNGTINGVPKTGSGIMIYNAQQGKTLPAISYTITTGSIWIERFNP